LIGFAPTCFGVIGFIGASGADRSLGLRFLRGKMLVAFGRDKFRKAFRFLSMADPAAKGQGPIPQTVVKKFARTTFATAHPNWVGFWQRFGIALRRPFEPLPRRRAYALPQLDELLAHGKLALGASCSNGRSPFTLIR
jgi:hypothetical protein